MENKTSLDDDKIEMLEQMLKEATEQANDSERKYEEVRLFIIDHGCILGDVKFYICFLISKPKTEGVSINDIFGLNPFAI